MFKSFLLTVGLVGGLTLAAAEVQLKYSGVLGQSQVAEPVPFIGTGGVCNDARGNVWFCDGATVYSMDKTGKIIRKIPAGNGIYSMSGDGRAIFFHCGDNKIYRLNPEELQPRLRPWTDLKKMVRSPVVAQFGTNQGFARKGKVFALDGRNVLAWDKNGKELGAVLALPELRANTGYQSLALLPDSGDLLVGSHYPDITIYRFTSDGRQYTAAGWPVVSTTMQRTAVIGHQVWGMTGGAVAYPERITRANRVRVGGQDDYYTTGIAADGVGGFWLSTSQGLKHYPVGSRENADKRIGGIATVDALAINNGLVLAAVERGNRMLGLKLDDLADSPLSCEGNEPWRVGFTWHRYAVSVQKNGNGFLLLEGKERGLWQFNPGSDLKDERWQKKNLPFELKQPQALAHGDSRIWILDNGVLREGFDSTTAAWTAINNLPFVPTMIAAGSDDLIAIADDRRLALLQRGNNGTYRQLWQFPTAEKIVGVTLCQGYPVVMTAAKLQGFDPVNGKILTTLELAGIPGGISVGKLSSEGKWLVVSDNKNQRLVRFKLNIKK